jgi:type III secretory pathway component EscR
MKQLLISIYILLSLLFFTTPISAQENEISQQEEVTQETTTEQEGTNEESTQTLDQQLQQDTPTLKLTFFQILVAILAPVTFIAIGYLLIKKLKL